MSSLNIGIAGAGIMGRLLAFKLVNEGHQVTIFDQDPVENGTAAAYTAAGMLTPCSEIESAELLIYQMGMQSLRLWPQLIKQLQVDVGYYQKGSLIVAHGNDKNDLTRFNQQLEFKLKSNQLAASDLQPRVIGQEEIAELEPEMSGLFSQATYLPEEAWLCPKCVMRALADYLFDKRVRWHAHTPVDSIGASFIRVKKRQYDFDWVVDCRGLGAKPDWKNLRGVRGEVILLQAPEVKINRLVRLMHPRYRLYVVPRMKDDLYIIGATQIESDDQGPITVRSSLELLSAAYSLHSGFAEARVLETQTNCRPALMNNLPKIESEPGYIRVNGLYRHGFLLAPTLAEEINHLIEASQQSASSGAYQSSYHGLSGAIS